MIETSAAAALTGCPNRVAPRAKSATGAAAPASKVPNCCGICGKTNPDAENRRPARTAITSGLAIMVKEMRLMAATGPPSLPDTKQAVRVSSTIVSANRINANGRAASSPKARMASGIPYSRNSGMQRSIQKYRFPNVQGETKGAQ